MGLGQGCLPVHIIRRPPKGLLHCALNEVCVHYSVEVPYCAMMIVHSEMVRSSLARPCSVVKHCMPEHFENSKLSKRAVVYVCVMMTHGNQERYVLSYLEYITWLGATHVDGAYKRHRQTIKLALRLKTWHCMLAVSLKCMTLCTCTACCLTLDLLYTPTDMLVLVLRCCIRQHVLIQGLELGFGAGH